MKINWLHFLGLIAFQLLQLTKQLAFCNEKKNIDIFPLKQPISNKIPWVWDAVYDRNRLTVELTTILQSACYFNQTKWFEINKKFPQYSNQLGNGSVDNILVNGFKPKTSHLEENLGDRFLCLFLAASSQQPIWQSLSKQINRKSKWSRIGTLQIICPVPKHLAGINKGWDRIQLQNEISSDNLLSYNLINTNENKYETEILHVCEVPYMYKKKTTYKYNLTVCTVTNRYNDRESLIEWIEYHSLLGINHFVIYDSIFDNNKIQLSKLLADYIEQGIITVVLWPYSNCVNGMASGRSANWLDKDLNSYKGFTPPKPIAQSAALSSCYSRYRSLSKYIVHIDDDEFLAFSHDSYKNHNNLVTIADDIFYNNPNYPAIKFELFNVYNCKSILQKKSNFPRLGNWNFGAFGVPFEGKLLMRTSKVISYFIHYLIEVENKNEIRNIYSTFRLSLYHYKIPPELSGNIYGAVIPIRSDKKEAFECQKTIYQRLSNIDEIESLRGQITNLEYENDYLPEKLLANIYLNYKKRILYTI
jgi:hypothetical protein